MKMKLVTIKLTQDELRRIFTLIGAGALLEHTLGHRAQVFSDEDTFLKNYIGAMALHTVKFTPGVMERVEVSSFEE